MKNLFGFLMIVFISCSNNQAEKKIVLQPEPKVESRRVENNLAAKKDICWRGTIYPSTPVFIHYQINENLIVGEITYLNTKAKTPIKIIGTIEDDKNYRILEFENNGNITGIITGLPTDNNFIGHWFSPKTKKELDFKLIKSDSAIQSNSIETNMENIYGDYNYQYSEAGYTGYFNITKINNQKSSFNIYSVTDEPARNIADIETDTINVADTKFIYKVPLSDSCEFEARFYKDFVFVHYTHGNCEGQFGNNATIDGIYLKTIQKKK